MQEDEEHKSEAQKTKGDSRNENKKLIIYNKSIFINIL